jgi:hypothetical protein
MTFKKIWLTALVLLVANFAGAKMKFSDVEKQTKEFIGYNQSIQLTADQEKIKKEALTAIAAPCCSDFTIATCCCPCNLAKSVWGLSNYLISKENYNATQLKTEVQAWIKFINTSGFSGNSCNMGQCGHAFKHDGCGGMKQDSVVF